MNVTSSRSNAPHLVLFVLEEALQLLTLMLTALKAFPQGVALLTKVADLALNTMSAIHDIIEVKNTKERVNPVSTITVSNVG